MYWFVCVLVALPASLAVSLLPHDDSSLLMSQQDLTQESADSFSHDDLLPVALAQLYTQLANNQPNYDIEETKKIPPELRSRSVAKRDRCYCDLDLFCFGCRRRKRPDLRTLLAATMFKNSRRRRDVGVNLHEISLSPAAYATQQRLINTKAAQ